VMTFDNSDSEEFQELAWQEGLQLIDAWYESERPDPEHGVFQGILDCNDGKGDSPGNIDRVGFPLGTLVSSSVSRINPTEDRQDIEQNRSEISLPFHTATKQHRRSLLSQPPVKLPKGVIAGREPHRSLSLTDNTLTDYESSSPTTKNTREPLNIAVDKPDTEDAKPSCSSGLNTSKRVPGEPSEDFPKDAANPASCNVTNVQNSKSKSICNLDCGNEHDESNESELEAVDSITRKRPIKHKSNNSLKERRPKSIRLAANARKATLRRAGGGKRNLMR
jgi:hypothetical protein